MTYEAGYCIPLSTEAAQTVRCLCETVTCEMFGFYAPDVTIDSEFFEIFIIASTCDNMLCRQVS